MTDEQPRRGRPRAAEVDHRILEAAHELLRERGPAAVHIDAVAGRSGVARTTVYRRYRNRHELLSAMLDRVTDQGAPPAGDDVADKLRQLLERVRAVFDRGLGAGGVAAVLTDADPEFTRSLRATLDRHLAPLRQAMVEDAEQGLLRADADPDALLDLALGGYLAERLRYGEERADWLDHTAELLERAVRPDA